MREIKAFIRPGKVSEVAMNLKKNGFCCFTFFEGDGSGEYVDSKKEYPSLKHPYLHSKTAKLEVVCDIERRKINYRNYQGKCPYRAKRRRAYLCSGC